MEQQTQQTEENGVLYQTTTTTTTYRTGFPGVVDRVVTWARIKMLPWVTAHYPIVVLAIAALILAEIIWGTTVLSEAKKALSKQKKAQNTSLLTTQSGPSITLFSESLQAQKGKDMAIRVNIDTLGTQIDAATAVVTFDPAKVTYKRVESGSAFNEYTEPKVDTTAGTVTISGFMGPNTYFSGKGILAKVLFTPKSSGELSFGLQYSRGATDETTIATQGKEILESVAGTKVIVQ